LTPGRTPVAVGGELAMAMVVVVVVVVVESPGGQGKRGRGHYPEAQWMRGAGGTTRKLSGCEGVGLHHVAGVVFPAGD
jgi:hypothetical protein